MNSPLLEKLKRRWPVERWSGVTMVVGCSGGADSTALLRAILQVKPVDTTLIVAHFNHRLRGSESDEDERFVAQLAANHGCLFILAERREPSGSADVSRTSPDGSRRSANNAASEATLRAMRYQFLQTTAAEQGARYVAVAHTADDSVETTLHNLARGTGLAGLTGIAPHRDLDSDLVLIRPLIDVWRSEVIEYLEQIGQAFRHDSSNASPAYTRNRIRHRWLPMLEEDLGSDVRQAIYRSSTILADVQAWLRVHAQSWLDQHLIQSHADLVELSVREPIVDDWPIVQHALTMLWHRQSWPLMPMTHGHWNQLRAFFQSPSTHSNAIELPTRIRIYRRSDRWVIEKRNGS